MENKFFSAVRKGDTEDLKRIINNLSFNQRNRLLNLQTQTTNLSALHLAAKGGFLDICEILFEESSKELALDLTNTDERTPLHFAAMKGHLDICEFLVENGAILDPQDIFFIIFNRIFFPILYFIYS